MIVYQKTNRDAKQFRGLDRWSETIQNKKIRTEYIPSCFFAGEAGVNSWKG